MILRDQDWDYLRDVNFKEVAVYGEVTANVNDDIRLTGGLRYFKHETVNIAQSAIEAAGMLGSRTSISPLISLLKELDSIQDDPNTPGGPPMPGPGVPAGGGGNNEQLQRKRQLLSVVQQALKDITDERFNKPRDWEKWWQKNAKKFKEKED